MKVTETLHIALLAVVACQILWLQRTLRPSRGNKNEIILDSCALIDGRIVELAKAGFITQKLIIPRVVVAELQYLADHGDSLKRARARFGLDIIQKLQTEMRATVVASPASDDPVDMQLVRIAKRRSAALYTTDFNLNKVAEIEGVHVLNVNELSQLLRPPLLPGERAEVKIVDRGEGRGQGVGYLDNGTMVVVDKASDKIGKVVQVEFTRMLQTQAGRMMFANIEGSAPTAKLRRRR